jgi:hypothetical protein
LRYRTSNRVPAVTELMGGQADVLFGNPLAVMPPVTGSLLRPIAVPSSPAACRAA